MSMRGLLLGITTVAGVTFAVGPSAAQPERPYPTGRADLDEAHAPRDGGAVIGRTAPTPATMPAAVKNPCAGKNPCAAKAPSVTSPAPGTKTQ